MPGHSQCLPVERAAPVDARAYETGFDIGPDGRLLMMRLVDTEQFATHIVVDLVSELRERLRPRERIPLHQHTIEEVVLADEGSIEAR